MTHVSSIGSISYRPMQLSTKQDGNICLENISDSPSFKHHSDIDYSKSLHSLNQSQANIGIAQVAMQNSAPGVSSIGSSSGDIAQPTTGTAG